MAINGSVAVRGRSSTARAALALVLAWFVSVALAFAPAAAAPGDSIEHGLVEFSEDGSAWIPGPPPVTYPALPNPATPGDSGIGWLYLRADTTKNIELKWWVPNVAGKAPLLDGDFYFEVRNNGGDWVRLVPDAANENLEATVDLANENATNFVETRLTFDANSELQNAELEYTFYFDILEEEPAPALTSPDSLSVTAGDTLDFTVVASGNAVSITAEDLPSWLSLTDNGDGTAFLRTVDGQPVPAAQVGAVPFTVVATNSGGGDQQEFTLTVLAAPIPTSSPTATPTPSPTATPTLTPTVAPTSTTTPFPTAAPSPTTSTSAREDQGVLASTGESPGPIGLAGVLFVAGAVVLLVRRRSQARP